MIESGVRIVSVGRLAAHLKSYIDRNQHLRLIGIRGEVSNFRRLPTGFVYFDLKDDEALLSCVVYAKEAARLPALANGQAVIATGYVTIYPKSSRYQLVASQVKIDGIGDLHAAYEELKRKLKGEGLFDRRRTPLPRFPFRLALVSSRGAAGADDFVNKVRERAPYVEVVWFETPVQNMSAVPEIVAAIDRASRADVDAIVIVRGGGSLEDLFPFSTEAVVRAVVRARHPVVTAVGHNVDMPLCDAVADLRAMTPTAAAEVVPEMRVLLERLANYRRRLEQHAGRTIADQRARVEHAARLPMFTDAYRLLGPLQQRFEHLQAQFAGSARERLRLAQAALQARREGLARFDAAPEIARRRERLAVTRERLRGVVAGCLARAGSGLERRKAVLAAQDPAVILERGYAIVMDGERVIRDVAEVDVGQAITARLARGALRARVESTEHDGRREEGR